MSTIKKGMITDICNNSEYSFRKIRDKTGISLFALHYLNNATRSPTLKTLKKIQPVLEEAGLKVQDYLLLDNVF